MKLNDIRVGNYVKESEFSSRPRAHQSYYRVEYNDLGYHSLINPLDITKELCKILGFDIKERYDITGNYDWIADKGGLRVVGNKNKIHVSHGTSGERTLLEHIKYVHQLQNFYYEYYGTELIEFIEPVLDSTNPEKEYIKSIIKPENDIEKEIIKDSEFIEGVMYGKPRPGHNEGKVIYHIKEVLANIDKFYNDDEDRKDLRLIAILHDTFKYKVDQTKPKSGDNHHGWISEVFAEKYCHNTCVLQVILLHDEAYNAWSIGGRRNDWYKAEERAKKLINNLNRLGSLNLYLKFYHCDNATGDKTQENYEWFKNLIK